MTTTAYITLAQLEDAMSDPNLVACLDDDGSGSLSPTEEALATDPDSGAIARASSIADGYLALAGYSIPLTGDAITPAMRHHVAFLAAHFCAKRRPEYRDQQGRAPYWSEAAEAREFFKELRDHGAVQDGGPGESTVTPFVTHSRRHGERVTSDRNPHRSRRW